MREKLEQRRTELQAEHERGATMLQQVERDRETLTQTLLRISGALQLLNELLTEPEQPEGGDDGGNH